MVKSLRVADRGVDGEGQDDWISPALPPLAMIKQVCRDTLSFGLIPRTSGTSLPYATMGVRVYHTLL